MAPAGAIRYLFATMSQRRAEERRRIEPPKQRETEVIARRWGAKTDA